VNYQSVAMRAYTNGFAVAGLRNDGISPVLSLSTADILGEPRLPSGRASANQYDGTMILKSNVDGYVIQFWNEGWRGFHFCSF
jgi:hypothetical protein